MPYYLPEICSKDKFLINFIIENKKYDSFKFVESLDNSFQTKKNIIRSFGHSKDILVPNHKNYVDKHVDIKYLQVILNSFTFYKISCFF